MNSYYCYDYDSSSSPLSRLSLLSLFVSSNFTSHRDSPFIIKLCLLPLMVASLLALLFQYIHMYVYILYIYV